MRPAERGLMLLGCHLGSLERKPLTRRQLWQLGQRVRAASWDDRDRDVDAKDLRALGYGTEMTERILRLLDDQALLDRYVNRGERAGAVPLTRIHPRYPHILRRRLGADAPLCLWALGDLSTLEMPGIALVGSRDLRPENELFACSAGEQAAGQGYALISGNARGADQIAQAACLRAGGSVISVIADALVRRQPVARTLYLSEGGYDEEFSNQRALHRNRIIHALGQVALVAQCREGAGGTWSGSIANLRSGWSSLACFDDGSSGAKALEQAGARLLRREELADLGELSLQPKRLWDE